MAVEISQFNALLSLYFPGVVGLEVMVAEAGYSECRVEIGQRLMNPGGVVHGGVMFSLADTGMAVALIAGSEGEIKPVTIDMRMTYYAAARSGELVCKSRVVKKTRRLVFLESEIFNGGDEAIASGVASFYLAGE